MECIEAGVTDCTELAEELKVPRGTIGKWAKRCMDAGRLKKTKYGRGYELPDDTKTAE